MRGVMKAMVLTGHGGLDKYAWHEDWPMPELGPMEVLIKVGACGLNNTDVNTRTGWYSKTVTEATTGAIHEEVDDSDPTWGGRPIGFPRIQGADAVGEVVSVGTGADPGLIGKRVMVDGWQRDWSDPENMDKAVYFGSEVDGGFAEYATCDVRSMAVVNSELTDADLATFSCSYTTAEGMLNRASAGGGRHGARSRRLGRGGRRADPACQAPRRASDRDGRRSQARRCGQARPRSHPAARAREPAQGAGERAGNRGRRRRGRTLLADAGRHSCAWRTLHLLRRHRWANRQARHLRTFYLRDLTFTGSTVVPSHVFRDVVGYIERGEIKPVLAATYPLRELRAAQQAFVDKRHVGNIVVVP